MATPAGRGGGDPMRSLQESVDRLAGAFERLAERTDAQVESIRQDNPPALDDRDRFVRHVRRYMPFYALATIWAIMLALLPTRQPADSNTAAQLTGSGGSQAQSTFDGTLDGGEFTTDTGEGGTSGGGGNFGSSSGGGGGSNVSNLGPPPGLDQLPKKGKTRGGFDCNDGDVRQIPWSLYVAPCRPVYNGNNGGNTYRGVTAKEILVVRRNFPDTANSAAVDAFIEQAGFASAEVTEAARDVFVDYFNKVFELYGRKVKIVDWESENGDSTAEAQSKGREGACTDADVIAKELKAFAVVSAGDQFGECAAARGLIVFRSGAYFPERWYRANHPYVYHGVMGCERISVQVAEYIGKRLKRNKAQWARGAWAQLPRKYGTYVPNNDQYQFCVNVNEKELKKNYGMDITTGSDQRYNYALDVSRFPDEAAQAIVQFRAQNVTTIVLACDPISVIFLVQGARNQNYTPEWFNIGVATNDVDQWPRLWDPDGDWIKGSLFGMSQLSSNAKLLGPKSEPAITYKRATGTDLPENTTGEYWTYTSIFSFLQAAGPALTPQNMDVGVHLMPPGGAPKFEVGYTSYRDSPYGVKGGLDHSAIDDSREIYWMADVTGPDGSRGTYLETYGGKRFRNGQWPTENPPVYPKGG